MFAAGEHNLQSRTDDTFLLAFLRAKKHDQEAALRIVRFETNTQMGFIIEYTHKLDNNKNKNKNKLDNNNRNKLDKKEYNLGLNIMRASQPFIHFFQLKNYYHMKKTCPNYFKLSLPAENKQIYETECVRILSSKDHEGRAVIFFKAGRSVTF